MVEPRTETGGYEGASWLEYRALQTQVPALRDTVASEMLPFNVGEKGETERTFGQLVSGNCFSALGLKPAIGRFIRAEAAERPGTESVLVISYDYWQTRFRGAPHAVGQKLRVNERELTVVGVAPRKFQGTMIPLKFDLWVPATLTPALLSGARDLEDRSARGFSLIGMLSPARRARKHKPNSLPRWLNLRVTIPRPAPQLVVTFFPLGSTARSAALADQRAGHPARRYAAPAVGGLRKHRKPDAGSWKRPAARDGRARGTERGTRAHCQLGAHGKYPARSPGSKPRSSHCRVGHHGIARGANDWRIFRSSFRQTWMDSPWPSRYCSVLRAV
jgi:hypothetical protein